MIPEILQTYSFQRSGKLSLNDLSEWAKQAIVNMAKDRFTDPDDDWKPALFLLTKDRKVVVETMPLQLFKSISAKDILAEVYLPSRIISTQATAFALLLNTWIVLQNFEKDVTEEQRAAARKVIPSKHPDRREALVLQVGDAEHSVHWIALINRSTTKPPTLDEWSTTPGYAGPGKEVESESRFSGPIADALNEVRRSREAA